MNKPPLDSVSAVMSLAFSLQASTCSLWVVQCFSHQLILHSSLPSPPFLFFGGGIAGRDGTRSSSLDEHPMVDWAINISHPSVNNHYCLFTSLLQGAQRWLSFFVSHKALYFIDLPSTLHNFMLFQKSTHHLLMFNVLKKKKKIFFSLANGYVQLKPHWSRPPHFCENKYISEHWLFSAPVPYGCSLLTFISFWDMRWVCGKNFMKNEA